MPGPRQTTSRSGVTSGARVIDIGNVKGLAEFRKALRAVGSEWPKALRGVHKEIADDAARDSQGYARGMGGVQSHFAAAIRGRANQREARVQLLRGDQGANVAFWGAKKRTGWYARYRYRESGVRQHPDWVGASWQPAEFGEGPYAINQALAVNLPAYLDKYLDMVTDLAREAFPEGGP